ncbi:MAG TPA: hypothetical protein PK095_14335 [Myxococcota bacterium]|nr:hypothetical protein [Myxococcota bacterium]
MHPPHISKIKIFGCVLGLVGSASACDEAYQVDPPSDERLTFTPSRPERDPLDSAPVYTGNDPIVSEAQSRFPTALDLHAKVIRRSCSPNDGVCHNTKEYPDLHTAANFLAAVEAPCNVQAGTREAIFDRCERPGDRFQLATDAVDGVPIEIGQIHLVPGEKPEYSKESPPTSSSPGLHVVLADPIRTDRAEIWSGGRFIRTFVEDGLVRDIAYQTYSTRWWVLEGGTRLVGEVNTWQQDEVTRLMDVGVVEGDPNMNGVFGARIGDPIALMVPGSPEESYLIGRLRGTLEGEDVPGTLMPLANQPLSNAEMLALFCFIEGLSDTPSRLDVPIDYVACTYSRDPTNLDVYGPTAEVTWTGMVQTILEVNCGGCHDAETPNAGLPLAGAAVYDALLAEGAAPGGLRFIEPGSPEQSYLWLKLVNDPAIEGSPMPSSPISGWRPLPTRELDAIRAWITDGATSE